MITSRFTITDLYAGEGESQKDKRIIRQMIMLLTMGIVVFGTVYMGLLNRVSLLGYTLQEVRAERYNLQVEIEKRDIEMANESTLYLFSTNRLVQGLVNAKKPTYVSFNKDSKLVMKED